MTPYASITVLLVEDDPGDAILAREMLAGSGFAFEVESVLGLSEALARLENVVDCVLLDLGLPDAGGLDALDVLLGAAPAAAVIVLTGRADRDLAMAAVARGAQDYLLKSDLNGELLSRSIRYAVERKRSADAARKHLANELLAAESARLERGLLARPMLAGSGLRSAARYRSGGGALLLGGDFYDAIELPDGRVRILIGDVSGHGPDEAAIGVALRISWRGFVLGGVDGGAVLTHMQAVLNSERLHDSLFATACDATIAADRCSVTLRLAGHPPPILMGDQPVPLHSEPGLPLGIFESLDWEPTVLALPARWALIFYTDGIIEGRARGEPRARLETAGLVAALQDVAWSANDLGKLADYLLGMAEEQNGGPVADDIALFLIAPPDE
jgi:serine phosphatase RsbU (regulator of sigma subunit)